MRTSRAKKSRHLLTLSRAGSFDDYFAMLVVRYLVHNIKSADKTISADLFVYMQPASAPAVSQR